MPNSAGISYARKLSASRCKASLPQAMFRPIACQ